MLAINEFREFLTFYPTNRRADYAQYKLGMAHYYQMRAPERDQTETREAIRELSSSSSGIRPARLREEGAAKLREARDRLSNSEYTGRRITITARSGIRARSNASRASSSATRFHASRRGVFLSGRSRSNGSSAPAEALPYYDRLIKEFEKSEYLRGSAEAG